MTHPIPGADSENDDTPISMSTYGSKEECEAEHARRAAAKVGANVAADSIANDPKFQRALATYWQNSTDESRAKLIEVIDRRLAAGAPAETPKPLTRWTFDGGMAAAISPDGQWVRYADIADQLPPAHIAGDVEKDAARYRKIKADNDDCDAETFCLFFDSKSGGLISIESKDMDAELDAAMLSNSSSGEAG